jgi:hypothetical protein
MQRTFTVVKTVEQPLADAMPELAEFVGQEVEIIVVRPAVPAAEPNEQRRRPGFAKGKLWMSDDFDAPMDDFKDYM